MRTCNCSLAGTKACDSCSNSPSRLIGLSGWIDYSHYKLNRPRVVKTYTISDLKELNDNVDKMKYDKKIVDELKTVEKLIQEGKMLMEKYPKHKMSLQLGLNGLEELRSEMINAL